RGTQTLQQLHRVADLHAQRHLRVLAAQHYKRAWHQGGRQQRPDAEGRVTELAVAVKIHVTLQATCLEQQLARPLDDEFAGRGGTDINNVAVEQADTQVALDGLYDAADRWLAQVDGFGGAGGVDRGRKGAGV